METATRAGTEVTEEEIRAIAGGALTDAQVSKITALIKADPRIVRRANARGANAGDADNTRIMAHIRAASLWR